MRNMSFFYTKKQFINRTKTVTRRLGWEFIKPGDLFMGVEKAQGLGKGGKIIKLGVAQCVSTRWEPLDIITIEDVAREGFPDKTRQQFIDMFCKHMTCVSYRMVNRIEFCRMGTRDG